MAIPGHAKTTTKKADRFGSPLSPCVLHAKSDRDSNSCRTPVLKRIGHLFQSKSDKCSNGMSDSFSGALEWVSDMDWNAIPIQVGHLFQSKPDRYSNITSDGLSWLLGLGSARVRNEPVGVEGRYTTCQKGSVQMHEERNLYGTKTIIHASDQRNPPTEVSTSIIGASHRPQLRALSQYRGRLSPARQRRRAQLAFARRTERG